MANFVVYTPFTGGDPNYGYFKLSQFFARALGAPPTGGPGPLVNMDSGSPGLPSPLPLLQADLLPSDGDRTSRRVSTMGDLDPATGQLALVIGSPEVNSLVLAYCDTANFLKYAASYFNLLGAAYPQGDLAVMFYAGPANNPDFLRALSVCVAFIAPDPGAGPQVIGMANMRQQIYIAPDGTFGPAAA